MEKVGPAEDTVGEEEATNDKPAESAEPIETEETSENSSEETTDADKPSEETTDTDQPAEEDELDEEEPELDEPQSAELDDASPAEESEDAGEVLCSIVDFRNKIHKLFAFVFQKNSNIFIGGKCFQVSDNHQILRHQIIMN